MGNRTEFLRLIATYIFIATAILFAALPGTPSWLGIGASMLFALLLSGIRTPVRIVARFCSRR